MKKGDFCCGQKIIVGGNCNPQISLKNTLVDLEGLDI